MLALVNVAKLLQCAANHTHWNPEKPFAAIINRFIDTELQPLIDSLSQEILVRGSMFYASVLIHVISGRVDRITLWYHRILILA